MIPQRGGLPHSDIHGSTPARGSPWLFAACHVLHRLLAPRHPPNALLSLHAPPAAQPARAPLAPRPPRPNSQPMHRHHPHPSQQRCAFAHTEPSAVPPPPRTQNRTYTHSFHASEPSLLAGRGTCTCAQPLPGQTGPQTTVLGPDKPGALRHEEIPRRPCLQPRPVRATRVQKRTRT